MPTVALAAERVMTICASLRVWQHVRVHSFTMTCT